jgi:hypothetical protein
MLSNVIATDSGFIAVGYRLLPTGKNQSLAVSSSNGRDWAVVPAEGDGLGFIRFGNGTVVVQTNVSEKTGFLVGPPGGTWQFLQRDQVANALLFGNGVFLYISDGAVSWVSADGVDWSGPNSTGGTPYGFADEHFFAYAIEATPPFIQIVLRTSTDGVSWSDRKPLSTGFIPTALADVGNETLLLGRMQCGADVCSQVMQSLPRGTTESWAPTTEPTPWADATGLTPKLIAASETRAVVITSAEDYGSSHSWTMALPRSSESWQSADFPADWHLYDIAYGNGLFVVVGARGEELSVTTVLATSTDGVDWQERSIPR